MTIPRLFTILAFLAFYLNHFAWSQIASPDGVGEMAPARLSGEIFVYSMNTKDSPHFLDHWANGDVLLESGMKVYDQLLMYNGFLDELIWLHPTTFQTIKVDKGLVSAFHLISPYTRDTVFFQRVGSQPGVYVQSLFWGRISLVIQHRIKQSGQSTEFGPLGRNIFFHLKPVPEYGIIDEEGFFHRVEKFNRKTFNRVFPDYPSEIKWLFKEARKKDLQSDMGKAALVEALDRLLSLHREGDK